MTRRELGKRLLAVLSMIGLWSPLAAAGRIDDDTCPRCPKCQRHAHFVCHNRSCNCWDSVKADEQPLQDTDDVDVLACAYCGYAMHIDGWFEIDMKWAQRRGYLRGE